MPLDSNEKIDASLVESAVAPEKDVDGFHILNTGQLFKRGASIPELIPCTPKVCRCHTHALWQGGGAQHGGRQ